MADFQLSLMGSAVFSQISILSDFSFSGLKFISSQLIPGWAAQQIVCWQQQAAASLCIGEGGGIQHRERDNWSEQDYSLPWKLTSTYTCHSVVFLQLFAICILFQSCTDMLAVFLPTFFRLFSFDWAQVAENVIPYGFRKMEIFLNTRVSFLP